MAQLSTVIGAILRDMIVAQHEANMYAVSLEEVYKQNGRLEKFSLPTVAVGEVELNLRYGVEDDSVKKEQFEINFPQLRKLSEKVSHQVAQAILGRGLPLLQSLFPYNGTDEDAKLLADVALDKGLQQEYCAFLGRKILKSMQQCFTTLINDDGSINQNALHDCIIETCEVYLFNLKDLQPLFDKPGGSEAQEKIKASINDLLADLLPKLLKDINMKRKRLLPSMDVILNSEELAHLPEECLHTLHLHVSPNGIKLYTEE